MGEVVFLRDEDGTGSLHACSREDPGAIPHVPLEHLREARRRRDAWRQKAEGYDEVRLALREKVVSPWPPHLSRAIWAGIAADEKKRADDAEAEIERLRQAIRLSVEDIENGNSESAYMTLSRFCEPDTQPDEFTGAAI